MALNTHGIKINGIRKASGETVNWSPRSGGYTEIFFDRRDGDVWTVDQVSFGHNSWTVYHSSSIIKVCETSTHMSMQQIADAIYEAISDCQN